MTPSGTVLVTGFPESFVAVRVVRELLADESSSLQLVVASDAMARSKSLLGTHWDRVQVLEGDVSAMDLGLSGAEFSTLANTVRIIHHCAPVADLDVPPKHAERVNLQTTREVLELCDATDSLERLVHWSTALVSGNRRGLILENDLEWSHFESPSLEAAFRAERMVRQAQPSLPATILRPVMIVGDSQTGEIEHFGGLHMMVQVFLNAPPDLRLPILGKGNLPLNLVPIDYVVRAGLTIAKDPRSLDRTFHLIDPEPLTSRRVFDLIASAADRAPSRGFLPTHVASAVLRTPGLDRFASVPRAFVSQLGVEVSYDDRNTRELLSGTDVRCPSFEEYVGPLVQYVRDAQATTTI